MTAMSNEDIFGDIRPFNNNEAPAYFARLAREPELADALAVIKMPSLRRFLPSFSRWLASLWIHRQARSLQTVEDLQNLIAPELAKLIESSAQFSVSGLEHLPEDRAFVLISNHRDIVMDPALTNYALHAAGRSTVSIAIGNNLLRKPWIAWLMRLNKSFIVRRDVSGPRELLAASQHLSCYIRQMVATNESSIWIAQREGRAKDGRDATEPAVIKMLSLSRDRTTESAADVLAELCIIPVAISYELDPCDGLKAAEIAQGPSYQKSEFEDVRSIAVGISGKKGGIHLTFGEPITESTDVPSVVAQIDDQIRSAYVLWGTNQWAWEALHQRSLPETLTVRAGQSSKQAFLDRIAAYPTALQPVILAMYANPVTSALSVGQ